MLLLLLFVCFVDAVVMETVKIMVMEIVMDKVVGIIAIILLLS